MERFSCRDFTSLNLEAWERAVLEILQGRPLKKSLWSRTGDDLAMAPLYTAQNAPAAEHFSLRDRSSQVLLAESELVHDAEPLDPSVVRRGLREQIEAAHGWVVGTYLRPNEKFWREDLQQRVRLFELPQNSAPWPKPSIQSFFAEAQAEAVVLALPLIEKAPLRQAEDELWLKEREQWANSKLQIWRSWQGGLEAALFGDLALAGNLRRQTNAEFSVEASDRSEGFFADRSFAIAPCRIHNLGATSAQEIAWALAATLHWLREFDEHEPLWVLEQIAYHWAFDCEYFEQIAKIRAFRMLWADLLGQCGLKPPGLIIKGETSQRALTGRDAWNNVVRSTLAIASAALAGVDAYLDNPFDMRYAEANYVSHRLARTAQLVLQEESNLHRVQDPLAGSWYIEQLTESIAQRAWEILQDIEAHGGMWTTLESGWWHDQIGERQKNRRQQINTRRPPLIGVSDFVSGADLQTAFKTFSPTDRENRAGIPLNQQNGSTTAAGREATRFRTDYFDSRDFELLLANNLRAEQPSKNSLLILNWGSLGEHNARTIYALNFLGVAGFSLTQSASLNGLAEVEAAWPAMQNNMVVICSSDERYQTELVPLANLLIKLGVQSIWLAGPPSRDPHLAEAWRQCGIGGYIYRGCDVVQSLRDLGKMMGRAL